MTSLSLGSRFELVVSSRTEGLPYPGQAFFLFSFEMLLFLHLRWAGFHLLFPNRAKTSTNPSTIFPTFQKAT